MHSVRCGHRGRTREAFARRYWDRRRLGRVATASALAALGWSGSASAASEVAGGAFGVQANVNALLAPISIGALPSVSLPAEGGGPFSESLLSANLAGLAPVQVAKVSTRGNSGIGAAESSATVIDANVAGLVSVSVAKSRCSASSSGADGSAAVADLVVAGIPISTVDIGPNTAISLPVGKVIVNEQRATGDAQVTVNAVHVSFAAAAVTGDIVIAQSRCAVRSAARARRHKLRARSRP